ncbi:hypothetical protein LM800396_200075 [Listeria monocytogenes]|nr:hypothetical protein LM701377_190076 [Listeria monocytogenes]CUL62819.1 hypothetical protein LM800396_200075 [Listeria monocytogenes]
MDNPILCAKMYNEIDEMGCKDALRGDCILGILTFFNGRIRSFFHVICIF